MSKYTFFNDYLMSKNAEHFRVVKEMKYLDDDDDKLLVPALFYLGSKRGERTRIHRMEALSSFTSDFEVSNFDIDAELLCAAAFSLIAQILLLFILMFYNMSAVTSVISWSKDGFTITIVIITTVFFAKLVYIQWRDAYNFNAIFWKVGFPKTSESMRLRKALLIFNLLVNGGLGIVIVLFNIFFLLISKSVNEAILNSLALFFILEIDDTLKPDWDERYFDNRIAVNASRYITQEEGGDVQVDIKSSSFPVEDCYLTLLQSVTENNDQEDSRAGEGGDVHIDIESPSTSQGDSGDDGGDIQVDIISSSAPEDDCMPLLESDDKFVFFDTTEEDGQLVVTIMLWRKSDHNIEKFEFYISGANGRDFFDNVTEFYCVQNFWLSVLPLVRDFVEALRSLQFEEQRQNEQVSSGSATTVPLASFDALALASTSSFDAPSEIDVVKV
jgi:hypothetical protein